MLFVFLLIFGVGLVFACIDSHSQASIKIEISDHTIPTNPDDNKINTLSLNQINPLSDIAMKYKNISLIFCISS